MRKKLPRLPYHNPSLWAQLQELRRPLESTRGNDPDLALLLDWPLRSDEQIRLAGLIAMILMKDGPITIDTQVVIRSRKREVIIAPIDPGGKTIVAVLTGAERGTRYRVDHALGVELFRGVLEELRRLKRALRDFDDLQKIWGTIRKRYPVAARLDSHNLARRFLDAVKPRVKSPEPLENIAAELTSLDNPGVPKASVIIRDAGSSRFSRHPRATRRN